MFDLTILSRQTRDITAAQFGARDSRRGPAPTRRVRRSRRGSQTP